jgi:transcription elongation factor Elf1
MSIFVDIEYVRRISPRLPLFKQKSPYLFNCRCPLCGDSKKNKFKARGYFYRKKDSIFFSCHNCGESYSIGVFLKKLDQTLYREYLMAVYKEREPTTQEPDYSEFRKHPVFKKKINLPTIESLLEDHPAKQFLLNRKISRTKFVSLYYADNFLSFIDELIPGHGKNLKADQRIVIPFYDEKNTLLGVQARAISNSEIRYITIKLNEENRKLYGLDKVDFSKKIYIVEGPFDSMFLDNSIATMEGALHRVIKLLGEHDYVFVSDNEPRNKQIVNHIKIAIDMGQNVCVWPRDIVEKDINDMINAGRSASEIQHIIDNNTFNNLRAKLEFDRWKKI